MFTKSKSLLALLLTGGILATSCEKDDLHEITPNEAADSKLSAVTSSNNLSSVNLIFEETVEGSNPFSTAHSMELGTNHALTYVTNPSFGGSKSARFEIRETDPLVKDGKRAEVTIIKGVNLPGRDMWYSFAAYFPSNGFAYDETQEMISQWYQNGSPATGLRINRDRFYLETGNEIDSRRKIDLGKVTKDTWHEFAFHFIHSYGSDGLIEVWHNGTKILTHKAGNMYNTDIMPKWKIGLYKSSFKYNTSLVDKRVAYFDNVRVGNEKASLNDMITGASTTTEPQTETQSPTPTPTTTTTETKTEPLSPSTTETSVVSFTLINSSTEKDIQTVQNGATLSLQALGTSKFNIRANTASKVGSVSMSLSGAQSKSRVDDEVPYALFGDDKNGNYYSWTPSVGTYTLKATTYAGDKGNMGSAIGKEYSITFTITR